jgi:hypothetical protein
LLLIIAFFASLTIVPIFQLPSSNPYNISNPFSAQGFNPDNSYIKIVFIIGCTLGLFLLMRRLYGTKHAWVIKVIAASVLLANLFIFNMLHIAHGYYPADIIYANGIHSMDNFHSGEQLSPANDLLSGVKPYSQMFFLRGAGVDVLLPALGFVLFGKSIGSFLLVSHLLMLLTAAGFFVLMAVVVKGTLKYIAAITLFYVSDAVSLVQPRDIPVWVVTGLVILVFRQGITEKQRKVYLVIIGLLSSLELYIAIDRGILLVVLASMVAIAQVILSAGKNNKYVWRPRQWRANGVAALYVLAGALVGFVIPALMLGEKGFIAFFKMTFIQIPSYGGLLVSTPFPSLFTPAPEYFIWGPVLLAVAAGYTLIKLYGRNVLKDLQGIVPYTLIFIFTVLGIKAGANRVNVLKMATVVAPLYFISFLIMTLAIQTAYNRKQTRAALLAPILLMFGVFTVFAQLDFQKLLQQPYYTRADLVQYKNMPHTPDEYWIREDTRQIRDYITTHTTQNDYIFAFPSNPAYYYLTNRKNPTRFYESWYADPQPFTNEMLADLKKHEPKVVIYEDGSWMDAPDGISMKERLPEVSAWLKKTYPKETKIGNARILEK